MIPTHLLFMGLELSFKEFTFFRKGSTRVSLLFK